MIALGKIADVEEWVWSWTTLMREGTSEETVEARRLWVPLMQQDLETLCSTD